jgi:hypothetical protein
MFIGAISSTGIDVMLDSGIVRLYPYFTTFLMRFWRRLGFIDAPL